MPPMATISDRETLAARPEKNRVDPYTPYAFLVEPERAACGEVQDVATLFLTNRECPFKCIYCDLWKNTTDARVPVGAIPVQIEYALARLPPAQHVKLYNSGNFFDAGAIPPEDYPAIAERLRRFQTVIVENHPSLCGPACLEFRDLLAPGTRLEIALGLETAHPGILSRLNKRMTVADFQRAAGYLCSAQIDVRTFILLKPPFMSEADGVTWAVRSIEVAFDAGASCCSVIPVRAGNGMLDRLEISGEFAPPCLASLEEVLDAGLRLGRGRVFADLWDLERLAGCSTCAPARRDRLRRMNLTQQIERPVDCDCRTASQHG